MVGAAGKADEKGKLSNWFVKDHVEDLDAWMSIAIIVVDSQIRDALTIISLCRSLPPPCDIRNPERVLNQFST